MLYYIIHYIYYNIQHKTLCIMCDCMCGVCVCVCVCVCAQCDDQSHYRNDCTASSGVLSGSPSLYV